MIDFERAFDDAEKAAASTLQSATALTKQAKRLQRAAKDGNINEIKKGCQSLDTALGSLRQDVANAVKTWPFKDEEEEKYLKEHYPKELHLVAKSKGLDVHERDGNLFSYPSIIRVLPGDRALKIDRKKVVTLRPSHLAEILLANQKKIPRLRSDAFLEALYEVYLLVSEREPSPVVPLAKIYKALTALPGSRREYDNTDFAGDIYRLENDGPSRTRKGARVSFPASTGTRSAWNTFQFVDRDGQVIKYYGIQFSGGE